MIAVGQPAGTPISTAMGRAIWSARILAVRRSQQSLTRPTRPTLPTDRRRRREPATVLRSLDGAVDQRNATTWTFHTAWAVYDTC